MLFRNEEMQSNIENDLHNFKDVMSVQSSQKMYRVQVK